MFLYIIYLWVLPYQISNISQSGDIVRRPTRSPVLKLSKKPSLGRVNSNFLKWHLLLYTYLLFATNKNIRGWWCVINEYLLHDIPRKDSFSSYYHYTDWYHTVLYLWTGNLNNRLPVDLLLKTFPGEKKQIKKGSFSGQNRRKSSL